MKRWLLPAAVIVTLTGYFGPWVGHRAAGLVITGLDLGEYVKFLPQVRAGAIWLWRPGFYAPLAVASAVCSLAAYRRAYAFPSWVRVSLLATAGIAATNLTPPAWTPARLLEPEFRVQTTAMIVLLFGLGLSPLLARLPDRLWRAGVILLAAAAVAFPLQGFLVCLPAIAELYGYTLRPAWGMWLMLVGLLMVALAVWRTPPTVTRIH